MLKRLLALLLAVILLLSLAACGGETAQNNETGAVVDDGGEYHGEMPIVKPGDEPITLTIGIKTNGNVTDYKDNDLTRWLEEQTGLNLEFMQFSGTNAENATQIALMIASGEKLPDILGVSGISKVQSDEYGLDGYFIDLKPYFEKYAYYHKEAFERLFPDDPSVRELLMTCAAEPSTGAIYNFAKMENAPGDTPVVHAWINQTWLDKLGLSMPRTISELHDVLVAFRDKDPNGNGKQDEIPMIGKTESTYVDILRLIVNAYIYWNHNYHFNVGDDGKLYTPYTTDEYRQALCLISDWVGEGLISTLTWTQSSEELKGLFNPGEGEPELCGVITGHPTINLLTNSPSLYDYEPLPPLKAETPLGGYGARQSHAFNNTLHITSDCKHPVEAFKLLDFMCCDEGFLRGRYGIPGVNWEFLDRTSDDPRGAKMIRILGENAFSTQNNINWHSLWTINDYTYHQTEVTDDWSKLRGQKYNQNYKNYLEAGQPEKRFDHVVYLREETERLTEIQKELVDYIKDRRAQFCTGVLDPKNDAQWQEYLDGLQALHYDEWLSIAQAAYDRMNAN